ncbi:uncharacterized protein CLUP02_05876 [Colletotrichum lupini]|uniref:Uncharacterized protein n=1 Tax=Colletotrichum lupini TaxID=145971 RepID=A0A9Q8WE49_9PEZI|nr:uncharacterized protein CLUP02_05876 [Colletotrichum lupini]UQC80393.1 hypothetical protein CLUP02_05876 [Colletotrichum lupini]
MKNLNHYFQRSRVYRVERNTPPALTTRDPNDPDHASAPASEARVPNGPDGPSTLRHFATPFKSFKVSICSAPRARARPNTPDKRLQWEMASLRGNKKKRTVSGASSYAPATDSILAREMCK